MKKYILTSIKLTAVFILICCVGYPLLIGAIGRLAPGGGGGETVSVNGKVVGYAHIGQRFTDDQYFQGRPSAVDYNAAGSGGSNKGASNPAYLATVQARIDSFLAHNPGITPRQIPAEMVTASGSGLDPDISPVSAYIQVKRIAAVRRLTEEQVTRLVNSHVENSMLGPSTINVLKLNVALDELSKR